MNHNIKHFANNSPVKPMAFVFILLEHCHLNGLSCISRYPLYLCCPIWQHLTSVVSGYLIGQHSSRMGAGSFKPWGLTENNNHTERRCDFPVVTSDVLAMLHFLPTQTGQYQVSYPASLILLFMGRNLMPMQLYLPLNKTKLAKDFME